MVPALYSLWLVLINFVGFSNFMAVIFCESINLFRGYCNLKIKIGAFLAYIWEILGVRVPHLSEFVP